MHLPSYVICNDFRDNDLILPLYNDTFQTFKLMKKQDDYNIVAIR